jgi:hypothetical protein
MEFHDERIHLLPAQLLEKKALFKRWKHMALQDIEKLCLNGELRAYERFRFHGQDEFFRPTYNNQNNLKRLHDDIEDDYFLLEDVKHCEEKYPYLEVVSFELLEELRTELAEKDSRIAELEKELRNAEENLLTTKNSLLKNVTICNGKGLVALVCRMRRDGKSDQDIAKHLYDDGKWCSYSQVGALLHPDEGRVAADSMQQRGRRLLGKA